MGNNRLQSRRPRARAAAALLAVMSAAALSSAVAAVAPAGGEHWSLRPVAAPAPLPVKTAGWVRNPIDQFILASLEAKGLSPSPAADKRTLIRRATFDLHGLPPTPEEVGTFVADESPDAYEKVVDRLLASPRYGERWGRHWLDVAHYADTHGFERDQKRPNAWRYRDWVIGALNRDLPYDQFLRDQIAGDVVAPEDPRAIAATGFLAAGPWDFVGQVETGAPTLRRRARADDLDDMVTTVVTATVGLTINCARCHDHKFDPIPITDYYRLSAVFAGVTRGDRPADPKTDARRKALAGEVARIDAEVAGTAAGDAVDLADVIAGGNGSGNGTRGHGIDPRGGKPTTGRAQFLDAVATNTFARTTNPLVDGVFVPDGGPGGRAEITVSSTGLTITGLPDTAGQTWDYVTNAPVSDQKSSTLAGVDYAKPPHTLLALHANKGITFDLDAVRAARPGRALLKFTAVAGNGSSGPADFGVYVDGKRKAGRAAVTDATGPVPVDIPLAPTDRFLTLTATDAGGDIAHDQIFFGGPKIVLEPAAAEKPDAATAEQRRKDLAARRTQAAAELAALPPAALVYAAVPGETPPVHVLRRGDPESPAEPVTPGAIACVKPLSPDFGDAATPEGKRRLALAEWVVHPDNPLTNRVIVNRLWHYHFGVGIVDTPSDFGLNGGRPTHPELLDWLAGELRRRNGSLKQMHRLMMLSSTYRQSSSATNDKAAAVDADNRLLWRMNGRRLEAEAVRDSILAVSGKLNLQAGGPGFEPFKFIDRYAPIYEYITPDRPELWRRTVYSFVVRSVPNAFMDVLDCPNPSNLTPVRTPTTTALQALAMSNNPFVLQQANFFAERLRAEGQNADAQVRRAYALAFGRPPEKAELDAAKALIAKRGLSPFCRALLNANEFVYVD